MKMTVKIAKKLLEHAGYKVSLNESELLAEMAFEKREIQFEFKNKLSQIYQNWCLLQYIKLSKDKQEIGNHWSEELVAALLDVSSMKLVKGDRRNKVFDALKEMFYVKLEFNKADLNIKCRLIKKFNEEQIKFDLDRLQNDFKNNIDNLMRMIAFSSDSEIENYCYSFWKE